MSGVSDVFCNIIGLLQQKNVCLSKDSKLVVEERDNQASLKKLTFVGAGSNSFSIKYDQCQFPGDKMFVPQAPVHKGCDSILFCEIDSTPYILLFELKSSEPELKQVAPQFKNACCFLKYLDEVLSQFHGPEASIGTWNRHYFVFHELSTPLKKTPSRSNLVSSPENPIFIPVKNGSKEYLRTLLKKDI